MYDKAEQVVVFFKNSKMTYCEVEDVKFSNNKLIIRQDDEKYRKDTIVNFDNVESIEVIYRKEINK